MMSDEQLLKKEFLNSSNKAAIVCSSGHIMSSITYREVYSNSLKLKGVISNSLSGTNTRFLGLFMKHNIHIPSIVASLNDLGIAFIFLDINMNAEEFNNFIGDIKLNYIISLTNMLHEFDLVHEETLNDVTLFLWKKKNYIENQWNFESIFCVVRSSGTTNSNKIIRVENHCIKRNAASLRELYNVSSSDVIYFGTPLTFDPSLIELLIAMMAGACLFIVPDKDKLNPDILFKTLFPKITIEYSGITVIQIVPSVFLRWSEEQMKDIFNNTELKILAFGGEIFPIEILKYYKSKHFRMFNLYGITEVSCWASSFEITEGNDIYLGSPLDETLIEVRNEENVVIKEGTGEIFIGSNSRFCHIDNESIQNVLFRATGDIGVIGRDGIKYLGRKNDIIKRLGHRINLNKIEETVFKETSLNNKCIWCHENKKLLLFVTIPNFDVKMKSKILDKLRVKLLYSIPREAFPDNIDILLKFPLTTHGKIDKRNLIQIYLNTRSELKIKEPHMVFHALLGKYLGISQYQMEIYRDHSFFEMGGNSISSIQLLSEFKELIHLPDPSEFIAQLFDKNLGDCFNYLKNCKFTLSDPKLPVTSQNTEPLIKRMKPTRSMKVSWLANLDACIDSPPLVFKHCGTTLVAAASFSNLLIILEADSGIEVFRHLFENVIESKMVPSPCGNVLFASCFDGRLYCIDVSKRMIKWYFVTEDIVKCSPCFCRSTNGLVFGSYDRNVYCIDRHNGLSIWKVYIGESVKATPLHDEETKQIFITTISGSCLALSEDDGHVIWRVKTCDPIFGSPCFLEDKSILFANVQGTVRCLSLEGKENFSYSIGGHIFTSLINYNEYVIFGCQDNNLYVAKASSSNFNVICKLPMESPVSTPHIYRYQADMFIVAVTTTGILNVIDFENLEVIDNFQLPSEVFSSPTVYNNKVYVGCRDNHLYCIDICGEFGK